MALTIEQVKEAFQNAMPRRRDEFEEAFEDRFKAVQNESNYQGKFIADILRLAKAETRKRSDIATTRIEQLLDSGWKPEFANGIMSAYIALYSGFDHWKKDPTSDLYGLVKASFSKVGLADSNLEIDYGRRLGSVQVEASNEAVTSLVVYAGKYVDFAPAQNAAESFDAGARVGYAIPPNWKYHVFISHASPDKEPFVRELAEALRKRGLEVWYDAFTLKIGDSLREKIDEGLRSSQYGIVVLSKAFFERSWPKHELDGLFSRQTKENANVILPIWHNVTAAEVDQYSLMLGGRLAANSANGIPSVVNDILTVVAPTQA
jgi:hypothetical protein